MTQTKKQHVAQNNILCAPTVEQLYTVCETPVLMYAEFGEWVYPEETLDEKERESN
jgi:hypothetical protein